MKRIKTLFYIVLAMLPSVLFASENIPVELVNRGLKRGCNFEYYPSKNLLRMSVDFSRKNVRLQLIEDIGKAATSMGITVKNMNGKILYNGVIKLKDGKSEIESATLPALDGKYEVVFSFKSKGKDYTFVIPLERKVFPWENNTLGLTNQVFPPYTPVKVSGNEVEVCQRKYMMNEFGLWSKVITKGKDILSAPITLNYVLEDGSHPKWQSKKIAKISHTNQETTFEASCESEDIIIQSKSTVEFDGMMKVNLSFMPRKKEVKLSELWIDIPVKENLVPLFHTFTDGPRINYSGSLPKGNGVVWDSSKARKYDPWCNSFVPYIMMCGPERGIAWFAENDNGWITEKSGSKKPIQKLIRNDGKCTLRVYLVNTATILKEKHSIVMGLQASPTKPMPKNWRLKITDLPPPGPVVPWGGLGCSYKFPFQDDWRVVDKIIECRNKGTVSKEDDKWFKQFQNEVQAPSPFGDKMEFWELSKHFARVTAKRGSKPVQIYFEEMKACSVRKETHVFLNDWSRSEFPKHDLPDEESFFSEKNCGNPSAYTNFSKSYQDYGLYYANEWLKRGVGLYWDNVFPRTNYNTVTSPAYKTKDGSVQPAITIWNMRQYMKRVWNLLNYWRTHQKAPLEWTLHVTNTNIFPINTWGTANLDYESIVDKPFPPEYFLTESTGLQVGNYPMMLMEISGKVNPHTRKMKKSETRKIDWAMYMVFEMFKHPLHPESFPVPKALDKIVYDYGYGKSDITVFNFWDDSPVLTTGNNNILWIMMVNKTKKDALLILSSWDLKATQGTIKINESVLGFKTPEHVTDMLTGSSQIIESDSLSVDMPSVYGMKIIRFSQGAVPGDKIVDLSKVK